MNVYQLTETQVLFFGLVLLRMIAFVFSAALFSLPAVNTTVKILFALVLTLCLYPTIPGVASLAAGMQGDLPLLAAREVLVGLILGFMTRIFFFALSMVGELISVSIGLASAQMYNPMADAHGGVMEQLHVMLGSLFFLLLGGHHVMISALAQSFEMIPLAVLSIKTGPLAEMAMFGRDLLVITIKMSAPVLVAILVANMAMGILGRAVPQLNVLVTSFPVTILLGLLVMIISMPLMTFEMNGLVDITAAKLMQVMRTL